MTIGGWIGLIIGLIFGTFMGLFLGGMMVDKYWKSRIARIEKDLRDAYKAPYEVEPGKKYIL